MNYKVQNFLNKITFGLTEMGPGFDLRDIWYNLKNGFSNLRKFFWVVWKYRSWDFHYNLEVFAKTIETYLEQSQYSPAMEIDDTRLPKERNMKSELELIKNQNAYNYIESAEKELGIKYPYKDTNFKEFIHENGEKMFELVNNDTKEEREIINKLIKRSNEIEQEEWNELWDIIKSDAQGWWN